MNIKYLYIVAAILGLNIATAQGAAKSEYGISNYACGPNQADVVEPLWVTEVCMAAVNKTAAEVVIVKYSDGSVEALPILLNEAAPSMDHDLSAASKIVVFNGSGISSGDILETIELVYSFDDLNDTENYLGSISGLSAMGLNFDAVMTEVY